MTDSFRLPADMSPTVTAAACAATADACGCHGNPVFDGMDARYARVLWTVIAINAAMFAVEMGAGHLAGS